MNISISSNIADVARALNRTASDVERASEKGLDAVANVALQAKQRQIDKTYRRAIPRRKNGRARWTRSGNFHREQKILSRPGERIIRPVGESEMYEARLAKLPAGPDGVNRSNPAAAEAHRITEPQAAPVFEQSLRNELGL